MTMIRVNSQTGIFEMKMVIIFVGIARTNFEKNSKFNVLFLRQIPNNLGDQGVLVNRAKTCLRTKFTQRVLAAVHYCTDDKQTWGPFYPSNSSL